MRVKTAIGSLIIMLLLSAEAKSQLTYANLFVQYDSAWTYKSLSLIPVRFKGPGLQGPLPGSKNFLTLNQAMQKGNIKVKEIKFEQGADINWLQVANTGKQDILMTSGEMLSGGKQDRMIGQTTILPAGETGYLNVYCIEKGRWDNKPRRFRHSGSASSDLKKTMHLKSRQHDVWKEIDRQFEATNVTGETRPYIKLHNNTRAADTGYYNYFIRKYMASDSMFAGFIAVTADRIINTDLFSTAPLTTASFRAILSSYTATAVSAGGKPVVARKQLETFADKVMMNEQQQKKYVEKHGIIHKYQGTNIHLVAYDDGE